MRLRTGARGRRGRDAGVGWGGPDRESAASETEEGVTGEKGVSGCRSMGRLEGCLQDGRMGC